MSVSLFPPSILAQLLTNGGLNLNAGLIYTYIAGGTTPQATYTTSAGNVSNANPIVVDASGRPPSEIWLTDGSLYRFDVKDSLGTLIKSYDNISAPYSSSVLTASGGSALIGNLQVGTGAVATTVQADVRDLGARPEQFGAVGDGTTDDNAALQKWLNKGGRLYLPAGKTYKNTAGNLTGSASTEIYFAAGSILLLNTTRLTFLNVNNIKLLGPGKISSTALNITDSLPTDWSGRGIVEFGGTAASPAKNYVIQGVEVLGDWIGTPGNVINANDRRKGIAIFNAQNALVQNCEVHGVFAEAVYHNGGVNDRGIWFVENYSHDNNHDAFDFNDSLPTDLHMIGNYGRNCLTGIEFAAGEVIGNTMASMIGGGYTFGAGAGAGPITLSDNRGISNGGTDFSLAFAAPVGPIKVTGNQSYNAGVGAFTVSSCNDLTFIGNTAIGYGRTGAGKAFGLGTITRGVCAWNSASNPGAFANGCLSSMDNTAFQVGPNFIAGQASPTVGFDSVNGNLPQYATQFSRVSPNTLTGSVVETTLWTFTIPAKTLGITGGVRIRCGGSIAGVNNTKTMRLKWGAFPLGTIVEAAGNTDAWMFETIITNTNGSQASQNGQTLGYQALALVVNTTFDGIGQDTTADVTVVLTGQLANIGDTIKLLWGTAEPFQGLAG